MSSAYRISYPLALGIDRELRRLQSLIVAEGVDARRRGQDLLDLERHGDSMDYKHM